MKISGRVYKNFGSLILLVLLMGIVGANPLSAQKKIYIITDLEGVSGVFKFKQTREKDTPLNVQACEYFMDDLSAVIRGLKDGGATEILVIDGHGNQCVIPHMMESGVKYATGVPRPSVMWGLDASYAGMVQFGAHAMMGTQVAAHAILRKPLVEHGLPTVLILLTIHCSFVPIYFPLFRCALPTRDRQSIFQ